MRSLAVLPLVLLGATSVVADQSFQEYLEETFPSCIVGCATGTLNNVTECSKDATSSNNREDIDCVCNTLREADRSVVRQFVEDLSGCVFDSDCSEDDLEKISDVEAENIQDSVCQSDSASEGSGEDNGATLLSAGSTFLLTAGAAGIFAFL
ncbi:uncharacterized protein APUU_11546S [Aspergillus puulaauensis]|uniref:Extracellular membrane protein CFEM domain-containing protein n=1 Tax=Aspergillus puulaauensis TaxID=1220207 RepID=A0A7R7XCI8_9EURO|nr:uncharacterized protein APUU_11546S [Aspergillus puulaauensis]BCS18718.1 hypothetical protein APUU_11546S [Aspergillus puulaauensis]